MSIKSEDLKLLAKSMGYEVRLSELNETCTYDDGIWVVKKPPYMIGKYNPLTNNDQMVEIMEKLEIDILYLKNPNYIQALIHPICAPLIIGIGKTINEAVLNAASELVKDK